MIMKKQTMIKVLLFLFTLMPSACSTNPPGRDAPLITSETSLPTVDVISSSTVTSAAAPLPPPSHTSTPSVIVPTRSVLATATAVTSTATATVAMSTTVTMTAVPQPQLQLTFAGETRSGYTGLFAIDVACPTKPDPCLGEPQLLFEIPSDTHDIAWSPDGSQVVFTSEGVNKKSDIFLADWNGDNMRNLTSSAGSEGRAVWSLDGTRIAYIYGSATEEIAIRSLNLEDGSTQRLLENVFNPDAFVWLSDGSLVAYVAQISGTDWRTQITVANTGGQVLNQIPTEATDFTGILDLTASPDGLRFAFTGKIVPTTPGPATNNIYVTDRISGDYIALTDDFNYNLAPAWSLLGDRIAFTSNRDGNYDIYLVSSEGEGLLKVTDSSKNETSPAWRLVLLP